MFINRGLIETNVFKIICLKANFFCNSLNLFILDFYHINLLTPPEPKKKHIPSKFMFESIFFIMDVDKK